MRIVRYQHDGAARRGVSDGGTVYPGASGRADHGAELVTVIGTGAHRVERSRALSHVGGCVCGDDVTARDLQESDLGGQWTRGKGFATFCPIGPWLETSFDPTAVRVPCSVDGEPRQDGRPSSFIFDLPL